MNLRSKHIILCLLSLSILTGCQEKPKEKADNRTAVQTIKPGLSKHQQRLKFPGVTSSAEVSKLSFQASGQIQELTKDTGDTVQMGEYLGRVNSTSQQAQIRVAQAQLASSRARHQELLAGSRQQEISSDLAAVRAAEAAVAQAKSSAAASKAALDLAQADRDRYARVFEAKALPKQQMQQSEAQFLQAQAQYDASKQSILQAQQQLAQSKQSLSLRRAGPRPEQIASSASNIDAAAAQLAQTQAQMQFTELKAPFSGIISNRTAEVGDLSGPGQVVYELRSQHRPEMIIQVPSLHINKLRLGMTAKISFIQLPGEEIQARVSEIQPVNDGTSRNFRVKITMKEWPLGRELSGVIGTALFELSESEEAYTVPVSALKQSMEDQSYTVFIVKNGKATLTPIEVVTVQDEEAIFKAEIPDGAAVVISGQEYLRDGQDVRIVNAMDAQTLVTPNKSKTQGKTNI